MANTNREFTQPNPGSGFLYYIKNAAGTPLWGGPFTLPDGTSGRIEAKAVEDGKKSHFDVTINSTTPWKKVADFKLKAFGEEDIRPVEIPGLGKGVARRIKGVVKDGVKITRNRILIKLEDAKLPDHEIM